jgi:hypothetical protein
MGDAVYTEKGKRRGVRQTLSGFSELSASPFGYPPQPKPVLNLGDEDTVWSQTPSGTQPI